MPTTSYSAKHLSRLLLAALSVALAGPAQSWAYNVILPGDPILAVGFTADSSSPNGERAQFILDHDPDTKYLNFGDDNTGFIVTPDSLSVVQSFELTTAGDEEGRDPGSWILYGTDDPIISPDHSNGREENWTEIGNGLLSLPSARNAAGGAIDITNSTSYSSYKMVFPVTKDAGIGLMQVADVDFYTGLNKTGLSILGGDNPIVPIRDADYTLTSNSPVGEGAQFLIDRNPTTKYLNFGRENTGFIVTPSNGSSIVKSFRVTTANDWNQRDPMTWVLYGTNDSPITTPDNGIGDEDDWIQIDAGTFTADQMPITRLTEGFDVAVNNSTAYTSYRMMFPTLRNAGATNSMQLAEISLEAQDLAVLKVVRNTGEVLIEAAADITLGSYELRSILTEGLIPANWTSVASTSSDPDDTWVEDSNTPDFLGESDDAGGSDNGITILAGNTYSLGNIWTILPSDFEDLDFTAFAAGGSLIGGNIEYLGSEIPYGDYSGNGSVGLEDWPAFLAGFGGDYTDASVVEAYLGGDLDGDFDSDIHDFNLFVEAAGGLQALFGSQQAPEPSSMMLILGALVASGSRLRSRRAGHACSLLIATAVVVSASNAQAQTFTVVGGPTAGGGANPITSIPAGQMDENENSSPDEFFDDTFIASDIDVNGDLFTIDYSTSLKSTNPDTLFSQYAGQGQEPKTVFLDYGSSQSANWFMYAQRSGADPTADRVGMFEFWFSETPFNDIVPTTDPDSTFQLLPTDNRLQDSIVRPYPLYGDRNGRYVAMRLTVSELSSGQPVNNIGGHEFRLLSGPSEVLLKVNRATGEITLNNNLSGSTSIDMKSYSIESPGGSLDAVDFNGVGGDTAAFPAGNGTASSSGWDIGGSSNSSRLVEGYFSSSSTLSSGVSGISLGTGYNEIVQAEDLVFTWSNSQGHVYNGRVEYEGIAPNPTLVGDYNDDGAVDAIDYAVWRENLGTAFALPNRSPLNTGDVSSDDYTVWRDNYGSVAPNAGVSAGAAPEPGACMLVAMLLSSLGLTAARRR